MESMAVLMGEETEWSASTATLPLEQNSPRSVEEEGDETEEEEEGWGAEQRRRKGLRELLFAMDEKPSTIQEPQQGDTDSETEADGGRSGGGGGGATMRAELRLAEERVRMLEAQLLDAEETIYHLKAEKMEAWRRVEKLTRTNSGEGGGDEAEGGGDASLVVHLRAKVYDIEHEVEDLKTQHAVELEEQMAVIREQEREIMVLKDRLTEAEERADSAEAHVERLVARQKQIEYEQKEEEEDDDPVKMMGHDDERVQAPSPVRWEEEIVRHPTPHFDLDSPEVQYLLTSWTKNPNKLEYLRTWLLRVAIQHDRDLPLEFPMGIELPRLAPEIRDGFLTLVVPLLRKQPWREIQVHTKQYNDDFHTDLRIRVVPRRP